jgi:hypothetical protein
MTPDFVYVRLEGKRYEVHAANEGTQDRTVHLSPADPGLHVAALEDFLGRYLASLSRQAKG